MAGSNNQGEVRFGQCELQPATRQLLIAGHPARLGARAFDVLAVLVERRERVVTKQELLDWVWPGLVVEENNLQVHISALRKLLGHELIATIPGRGYQFTAVLEAAPGAPTGLPGARAIPNNLPLARSRFIGREATLAQCTALLAGVGSQQAVRLLTLTGVGGCGKTRLAQQLAQGQLPRFVDGVWFIDLAAVQDAQRVAFGVAAALGVRESAGMPLIELLTAHLTTRRALLVLDNCEHLLRAVAEMVEALLAGSGQVTIIATSRESLHVAGEQVFPVPPLSLPAANHPEAMERSEAVQLFVDRARLALPDFALDDASAPAVGEICTRLDGIALAIELAAARVEMLSVGEIAARLDDRFRLLTGSGRAIARHQTLHMTLQWSYDALTALEQQLFRQLAVFAGGCTLAAAVRVAVPVASQATGQTASGADPSDANDYAVLELLTRLHDKSLLVVDRDNAALPRYNMLETVRQYALERLNHANDADLARDRHLGYYLALAEQAQQQIQGPQQGAWMALLRLEQENLLAAHAWSVRAPAGQEAALRLTASLWRYWVSSAQLERGYRLAQVALAQAHEQVSALWRCRALWAIGQIAFRMGRYTETLLHAEQCLTLARAIGDTEQITAGLCLWSKGLHATGQLAEALAQYEATCVIARTLPGTFWLGVALNDLAELHRDIGNLDDAERCYEEAISIARQLQSPGATFVPLCNLARLGIASGKLARARWLLLESLVIAKAAELRGMGEDLLEVTAGLAATCGDYPNAARFAGAAQARMQESGSQREPVDEAFVGPLLACAQTRLGDAAFAAAEAAGCMLDHVEAIAEVEQWLRRVP